MILDVTENQNYAYENNLKHAEDPQKFVLVMLFRVKLSLQCEIHVR